MSLWSFNDLVEGTTKFFLPTTYILHTKVCSLLRYFSHCLWVCGSFKLNSMDSVSFLMGIVPYWGQCFHPPRSCSLVGYANSIEKQVDCDLDSLNYALVLLTSSVFALDRLDFVRRLVKLWKCFFYRRWLQVFRSTLRLTLLTFNKVFPFWLVGQKGKYRKLCRTRQHLHASREDLGRDEEGALSSSLNCVRRTCSH